MAILDYFLISLKFGHCLWFYDHDVATLKKKERSGDHITENKLNVTMQSGTFRCSEGTTCDK